MSWKREKKENNLQVFSRNMDGYQEIHAPITIGKDGRYEIYDVLSVSGGFGIIYRAHDNYLGNHEVLIKSRRYDSEPGLFMFKKDKDRAIKIDRIREKTEFEATCLLLFKQNRESRMPIINDIEYGFSPSIYGPHIDQYGNEYVINDDYVYNEPYIIMQIINGSNLWDIVKDGIEPLCKKRGYNSYFEWEKLVLEYAKELTTIFSEFHKIRNDKNGDYYYIYQDLKPENIILSHDRFLTLLDFGGITRINIKARPNNAGIQERYTETSAGNPGVGTFGFQAPEARDKVMIKNLDKRVDIYTLGATLFQLLTGFEMADILDSEKPVIPLKESLDGVCTRATFSLLERCLQIDREKRFSDMQEVRNYILTNCFKEVKVKTKEYI